MNSKKIKINFGSGLYQKVGYINVDRNPRTNPDIIHDLNKFPYPFEDNSAYLIEADHVLEHLENPFSAMKEIHRLLDKSGTFVLKVPHFSRGFTHPDHKRGFDVSLPYYFNATYKGGYIGTSFACTKVSFKWFAQPYLKKVTLPTTHYAIGLLLGIIFDFLANLSPFLCSRIWCFWVGGFEELEFHFKKE